MYTQKYGRTPLHEAIRLCSDEAVKLLLQHGGAPQVTHDPKVYDCIRAITH